MLGLLQAQWKAGSTYKDSFVTRFMDEWECMVMMNGDLTEVADEIIEHLDDITVIQNRTGLV